MGEKLVLSLANLFMAFWERKVIDANPPRQLRIWKRYIDDILVVWEGDLPSLENVFSRLNDSDRVIFLKCEVSESQIHFLDLNITVNDGSVTTTTYFKETDRNAYIPLTSCHHPQWLNAVPKGQFQRIRRNCSTLADYHQKPSC